MILIGRGLDLRKMIRGSEAGREAEGRARMSKSEDRSHGQAEGITRTCAVLRVRGKGKRSGREAEAGAKRERSESGGGT